MQEKEWFYGKSCDLKKVKKSYIMIMSDERKITKKEIRKDRKWKRL